MNRKTVFLAIGVAVLITSGIAAIVTFKSSGETIRSQEWQIDIPVGEGVSKEEIERTQREIKEAFQPENVTIYQNTKYGFTFNYPNNYRIGSFAEGEGDVVLLQDANAKTGLQITISPFDENINRLSEARIRQDLPDLDMQNVDQIMLGDLPAIFFTSSDSSFGNSVEVWFIKNGNLYQMSTYSYQLPLLEQVAKSMQF